MILTRELKIVITEKNFNYYYGCGYTDIYIGEEITIPIDILSSGSNRKIMCKCDGCGIEKEVIFKNYMRYGNDWLEYWCRKCSEKKRKETLKENYGVEYPYQSYIIRDRHKNTLMENYGVDNPKKIKKQP